MLWLFLQGLVLSASSAIECVESACGQVRSSTALQQVLEVVLAVGNTLNAGTHRGNAAGIRLDSLLKLGDVKVGLLPSQ